MASAPNHAQVSRLSNSVFSQEFLQRVLTRIHESCPPEIRDALKQAGARITKGEMTSQDNDKVVECLQVFLRKCSKPERQQLESLMVTELWIVLFEANGNRGDLLQATDLFFKVVLLLNSVSEVGNNGQLSMNTSCSDFGTLLLVNLKQLVIQKRLPVVKKALKNLQDLVQNSVQINPNSCFLLADLLMRCYLTLYAQYLAEELRQVMGDVTLIYAKCAYELKMRRECIRFCKEADEQYENRNYEPYELWARCLKEERQFARAADLVQQALTCTQENGSQVQCLGEDGVVRVRLHAFLQDLEADISRQSNEQSEPDKEWLQDTQICGIEKQRAKAEQVAKAYGKKKKRSRPKREASASRVPVIAEPVILPKDTNPLFNFKEWDVSSGEDSSDLEDALELSSGSQSEAEVAVDDAVSVCDEQTKTNWFEKSLILHKETSDDNRFHCGSSVEVDVSGFSQHRKRKQFYSQFESVWQLERWMQSMPDTYKRCSIELESAHKAVCQVLNKSEKIEIHGRSKCGQAFNHDEVCVQVLNKPKQTSGETGIIYRRQAEDNILYGRVVGVFRSSFRKEDHVVLACTCDEDEGFLLHPLCKSIPKIHALNTVTRKKYPSLAKYRIDIYTVEENQLKYKKFFNVNPAFRDRYVFLVVYLAWSRFDVYPLGAVVEVLECGTDMAGGLKVLEMQYNVPTYFDKGTVKQVERMLTETNIPGVDDGEDCSGLTTFTIDPANAKDLDDAMSIEKEDDHFLVGVHIADVAAVVQKGSPVDMEARRRVTSFYSHELNPNPMLPEPLSETMCSLLPNEKRRAVSVFFRMEESGKILKEPTIRKTIIHSSVQLSYEQAQEIIDGKCVDDVSENVREAVKQLHKIAQSLRKNRMHDSRFVVQFEDFRLSGMEHSYSTVEAHALIEEFMIKTNETVGNYLRQKFKKCVPIRCQADPSQEEIQEFLKSENMIIDLVVALQGKEIRPGSVTSVRNVEHTTSYPLPVLKDIWFQILESFRKGEEKEGIKHLGKDSIHPFQTVALHHWWKMMDNAIYRCSNIPAEELKHFSLNLKTYTHFTSPLRRYIDLVVQRMVHAATNEQACPYSEEEIVELCADINEVSKRQKQYSKGCHALRIATQLSKRPMAFSSVVESVTDGGAKLIIPSLKAARPTDLPFNLLDFSKKPSEGKDPVSSISLVTGKWKKRLYDLTGCPDQLVYKRHKPSSIVVNPFQHVAFVDSLVWSKMLGALFRADKKEMRQIMKRQNPNSNAVLLQTPTRDFITSEDGDGKVLFQQSKFSLTFASGRVLKVEIMSRPEKGLLTPHVASLQVCKNVNLCLAHMENPVGVLTKYATESTKRKFHSVSEYQKTWLPLLEMEAACEAVHSEENIVIDNITFTFTSKKGRTRTFYSGNFVLPSSFVNDRYIQFGGKGLEKLKKNETDGEDDFRENHKVAVDYLCIRCKVTAAGQKDDSKASAAACPEGANSRNTEVRGKGGTCCEGDSYTWIGHAAIVKVRRMKTKQKETDFVTVAFSVNTSSLDVPQALFPQAKGVVEVLYKSEVDRRSMNMIMQLSAGGSGLSECIALQRQPPKLDKKRHELGVKIEKDLHQCEMPWNNTQQYKAIERALRSTFTLIQGPPGTGKTYTGIKLIYLFDKINKTLKMKGGKKGQVLFCAPSNKAVDLVARILLDKLGSSSPKILRVYGNTSVSKDYPVPKRNFMSKKTLRGLQPDITLTNVTLHHVIRLPGKPYSQEILKFDAFFKNNPNDVTPAQIRNYDLLIFEASCKELKTCDVILCTCAVGGAGKLIESTRVYQCLIDESAMSTEPQTLIPIIANKAKQVVLIGDHKQLRPIIKCKEAAELGLNQSLFERYADEAVFLNTQYRMHPQLCQFPSDEFYGGQLVTARTRSAAWMVSQPLNLWPHPDIPHVFCHVEGNEKTLAVTAEEGNEQSKSNSAEVEKVVNVFEWLISKGGVKAKYINIMSQYRAQCHEIREKLNRYHQAVNVNTVVASQGGEWDYVIFSTVRSLPTYKIEARPTLGWQKHNLGFITDANQINVALTRARKGLVIIGNKNLLEVDGVFSKLLDTYGKQGCVLEGDTFPPREKHRRPHRRPQIPGADWTTA